MKLTDLNLDCLLRIFSYCKERDLWNLGYVSSFLRQIIDEHIFYVRSLDLVMCGHRNQPAICDRSQALSYGERIVIANNWSLGKYRERSYYHHTQMFPTKLHLERDHLYITHASYLRRYARSRKEALERRFEIELSTSIKSDIADFVKKRETIFAGRVCGSCFIYEEDVITQQKMHSAKEYLHCVDFVNDLYVTSTDTCCKLWRRSDEFGLIHFDLALQLQSAFKTVKISSDGQWLFGGLYTDKSFQKALRAVDVESGEEFILNSKTISIYDLKMKDEHVLFTANFDTTFRMFDRRSDRDVAIWEDPFDSSFYCLEYDGLYSVLCGAKYHSRVNLFDIRMPKKYAQLYFPSRSRQHNSSSPVYSIACDNRFLFVATDHNLRVLDFKNSSGISRDYRNIFSEVRRV